MKKTFLTMLGCIAIISAPIFIAYAVAPAEKEATCYGRSPCNACSTCNYCGHCAKGGGTCGVCR